VKFPHLVEMQRKYGKDGLVAVSVSLDNPEKKDAMGRVQEFLEKSKAAQVINLVLDQEDSDVVQERLRFEAPPCVYIFNRAGQWKQFDADAMYESNSNIEIDKVVTKWLKEK
jgi:hypothetical protein